MNTASPNTKGTTPDQVGDGWRLVHHDEEPHWQAQVWWRKRKRWMHRPNDMVGKPYERSSFYRVPIQEGGAK